MKTRTIILPLILIGCMLAAAGVALLSPPTEAEAEPVVKKQAERIIKNPVSVEEMESRNKKEESRNIEVAEAVIATITPTPTAEPTPEITPEITPTPEPAVTEEPPLVTEEAVLVMEEPVLVTETVNDQEEPPVVDSCFEDPVETDQYFEDIPDESSQAWEQPSNDGMQLLGTYYVTHYSAEGCGNAIGAAEVPGGMVEGISIAMPEWWMLGHWVYVDGYGQFRVDDISPDGIADIFHWSAADAVGADYRLVYLIG